MYTPVAIEDFLITFIAGAFVLLAGAGYALAFAWSRLYQRPALMILAWASYAILTFSVIVLTHTMNFTGYWLSLTAIMLVGYLLAPHAIWHLSVGTHKQHSTNIPRNTPDE